MKRIVFPIVVAVSLTGLGSLAMPAMAAQPARIASAPPCMLSMASTVSAVRTLPLQLVSRAVIRDVSASPTVMLDSFASNTRPSNLDENDNGGHEHGNHGDHEHEHGDHDHGDRD